MLLMTTTWTIIITVFLTFIITISLVAIAIRYTFIKIIEAIINWLTTPFR